MCTTCGCSSEARPRITDLQTGEVSFIADAGGRLHHPAQPFGHSSLRDVEPMEDRGHSHGYRQSHDHDHSDDHDHSHDPGHDHLHDHPHGPGHAHGHGHGHGHGGHSHTHDHDPPHHHSHDHGAHLREPSGPGRVITLERQLLAKNDKLAERNRGWFAGRGILALNLMSSPGAGKTSLLERMLRDLRSEIPMNVIEGDQETLNDAERIRATGCDVVQINTGTGCHLDAEMLARGVSSLDPKSGSVVLIENVGNLVCPALFDLGEHCKVVILSVTEGEDKPLKYPHMFRACELMILNKIDLLPHVEFDVDRCVAAARHVNPDLQVLLVSATRGDGLGALYDWLRARRSHFDRHRAL